MKRTELIARLGETAAHLTKAIQRLSNEPIALQQVWSDVDSAWAQLTNIHEAWDQGLVENDPRTILHVSDWNYNDKYYSVPNAILGELKTRIMKDEMEKAWDWFIDQVDYGKEPENPVRFIINITKSLEDEGVFLDYVNAQETVAEWVDLP